MSDFVSENLEDLRNAVLTNLRLNNSGDEMDCLQELRQLPTPVEKIHVVKFVTIRWLLKYACVFNNRSVVAQVENLDGWRQTNNFGFQFRGRVFDLSFVVYENTRRIRTSVEFSEGHVSIAVDLQRVPEFERRRSLVEADYNFVFEFHLQLTQSVYDKVFRKIIYRAPIQIIGSSADVDVRVPTPAEPVAGEEV